jgi:hypothetical protein
MDESSIREEKIFWETQRTLSFEFSRYVLSHPELAEKIPSGAQVIFLLDKDEQYNKRSKALAKVYKEEEQPVVFIKVDGLLPPLESRLINPHVEMLNL